MIYQSSNTDFHKQPETKEKLQNYVREEDDHKSMKSKLERYLKEDPERFQLALQAFVEEGKLNLTRNKIEPADYAIFTPVAYEHGAAIFADSKFEQNAFEDDEPLIPHVIHQLWFDYQLPNSLVKWINTIVEHHPNWQYWFWTPEDVQCLIERYFPQYFNVFLSYGGNDKYKIGASR